MPIDDTEAKYWLNEMWTKLEKAIEPGVSSDDRSFYTGMADGMSLALERFGPEWAKEESEKLWQSAEEKYKRNTTGEATEE